MVIYLLQTSSTVVKTIALERPSAAQAFRLLEAFECLWRTSRLHANAPTSHLFANVMPAILLSQYLLVLEQGSQKPLGLCTWAKMDKASEYRYLLDPTGLNKNDWLSGDRLWLIDWIGQPSVNRRMAQFLKAQLLPREVLRTLRVRPNSSKAFIRSFCGSLIEPSVAQAILRDYHAEYLRMHRTSS
ncbi:toxin-activating lysine-acyltransferase [Limnohabitans sp.]|uniref:toxin-activating lysine-acyltransferase n=1 Tax=Limnohabitans sp. TaxID=1907725 RepID=UPI00286EE3D8|nr:toxin-activating lysine-acyltransferase [Limnohabitans sp.]